jgi:diacylglycerol O-acyltransferase / trehalose O-mycolyltransferase
MHTLAMRHQRRGSLWPMVLSLVLVACGGANNPTPALQASAIPAPTGPSATPTPPAAATKPATTVVPAPGASLDPRVEVTRVDTIDERVRDLIIQTPSLPGPVGVRLLLPSGFDSQPDRRWPVLYLLHGAGIDQDAYRAWTEATDVAALVAPTDLLVVMPEGASYGWYSDWWNAGNGGPPMWETFHLAELRAILERDWHAGDQRAIAGLSMGGYGAITYAARHPGLFRAAASFSGPLDILAEKDYIGPDVALWGDPEAQKDVWQAHNPIDLAEALRGTPLFISWGNGERGPLDPDLVTDTDEAFRALSNQAFAQRLEALGIQATIDDYGPGTHTWPYFERELHRALPLLLEALGEPAL